jgi:hypothetical protein
MMQQQSSWRDEAVCANDKFANKWLSYDLNDVKYAKSGCARCNVKKECLIMALENDYFVGVVAGMSEYDYLNTIWKRASKEDESNWRTDNSTLSRLLQKAQ